MRLLVVRVGGERRGEMLLLVLARLPILVPNYEVDLPCAHHGQDLKAGTSPADHSSAFRLLASTAALRARCACVGSVTHAPCWCHRTCPGQT
eukprot:5554981-Prymnesium_polylepis.1